MEQKKPWKKCGRPKLPEEKRRVNFTLMLTPLEIKQLRKEHEGHVVNFGVFLREKLMSREAFTLSKPMDPEVRTEMTNLLKICGSMNLIAKRTEYNVLVSKEFSTMAIDLRKAVQRADYNVKEFVYGKSLIPCIIRSVKELKQVLLDMQKDSKDISQIIMLLRYVSEMEGKLKEFAGQFGIDA
ncbi:hypothetical protein [Dyadobacter sediminis]|uniref:hypothetical protein n=1 Tax=Dyadobacter sediminis TaxID=1493691 RepID=UPI001664BC3E|nr:hypothetical protein [Dyadobacter sediminis]GGB87762.1 hypothetical protein GCM10011325_14160 [Dyadobacter sediminis]